MTETATAMTSLDEVDAEGEDVLMELSPSTTSHLQALPPFLHPISPSLAALHMARMRLLCHVPPSANILSRWCGRCGGLRDGVSGPSRRRKSNSVLSMANNRQMTRTESSADVEVDMDVDGTIAPEGGSEAGPFTCSILSDVGNTKSSTTRKKANCDHCGHPFTRPKPDRSTLQLFMSARKTRAVRKASVLASSSTSIAEVSIPSATPSSSSATALGLSLGTPTIPESSTKPRPTLLHTPSLAYIPKEDPNPPTYPQPPPSSGVVKRAGSPDSGKIKKRKMKKSGLARLLAESKGREELNQARGRWGLE